LKVKIQQPELMVKKGMIEVYIVSYKNPVVEQIVQLIGQIRKGRCILNHLIVNSGKRSNVIGNMAAGINQGGKKTGNLLPIV
jgi:hypothetical protein